MTSKERKAARQALRRQPPADEISETLRRLELVDDQPAALLGGAYLDHILEAAIRSRFCELDVETDRLLFSATDGGVLSAFATKARIAFALGLIDGAILKDVLAIARVRNLFAHTSHRIDFGHPLVQAECGPLLVPGRLKNWAGYPSLNGSPKQSYCRHVCDIYTRLAGRLSEI